jgi:bacteriocin biosynthesis cyclodehydratase domain-containing protein
VRPLLRPGLRVLRRDVRTLQLGLDWPGLCTLQETPALRAVLAAVDGFRDLQGVVLAAADSGADLDEARAALDVLIDCGAVVDQASCRRLGSPESSWTSWWLLAGPRRGAADILAARQRQHVRIEGTGQVADRIGDLLTAAHVPWSLDADAADLVVLASDSEPLRSLADASMRDAVPHLWTWVRDVVGVVGPFVVPGVTGCLRCADHARAELDPAWPTLLESAAARPPAAAACDPVLAALVGAWTAQEIAIWASGLRPQTINAVIEVPQGFGDVDRQSVELHPHCGCGWSTWHDTMEA